ncbi:hypothetical protein VNI00_007183 [Paramarasmius palmivorus]|uniref:Uncharacterized protein n=1 Tax=Paramarasmius palmivorus TaxID=297713 RepID=A0AAW0D6A7_9AGAR
MAPQRTPHRLPTHDDRGRLIIPSENPRNRQANSLAQASPQQKPHPNPPLDPYRHYQRLPYPIVDQKHSNLPTPPHPQVAHPQHPNAPQSRDSYYQQFQSFSRTTSAPNITSASSQSSTLNASQFTKYYPNVIHRMNSNNQVDSTKQSSSPTLPFSIGSRQSSAKPEPNASVRPPGRRSTPSTRVGMSPVQANRQVPTQQEFNHSIPMQFQSTNYQSNRPSSAQPKSPVQTRGQGLTSSPGVDMNPVRAYGQVPTQQNFNFSVPMMAQLSASQAKSVLALPIQHDQARKPPSVSPTVAHRNDGNLPQGDQHSSTRDSTPEHRQPPDATPASRASEQTTASEPPLQLCTKYYHTQPVENPINLVWKDAPVYRPELVKPSSTNVDTIDPRLLFMKDEEVRELMDKEAQEAKSGVACELTVDAVVELLLGTLDGSAT